MYNKNIKLINKSKKQVNKKKGEYYMLIKNNM